MARDKEVTRADQHDFYYSSSLKKISMSKFTHEHGHGRKDTDMDMYPYFSDLLFPDQMDRGQPACPKVQKKYEESDE
jgi:hypothetical protein